ncbi:ABC transporter substrate-binding protein [Microbacterium sp. JZ101]
MAKKAWAGAAMLAGGALLLTACGGGAANDADNTIDGEPSGEIKVVTWRTDLVEDGTFEKYAEEFQKLHPDVTVTFEGITDYEGEMKTRLSTTNYGDVIGIPSMLPSQYEQFLEPLGETEELADTYRFLTTHTYEGTQYGLAVGGNANGILYNKRVFEEAGVETLPTTEDEWLEALRLVDENTDAIPYYTNYKDGWPLSQAFSNLGAITNDPDAGITLAEDPEPWTEGTDVYAIDSLLYETVAAGLTEDDPLATNWEKSKVDFATGRIATMALGSWAVSQMQAAAEENGASPEDVGFMAFPANVDGQQYATIGGDYNLGVSRHSEHKAAAWAFIQWLIEDSGFTETQNMISTVIDKPAPDYLAELESAGVELLETNPAPEGKENLLREIADTAQIDLWGPLYRQKLVDIARGAADGDKETSFAELNSTWSDAQARVGE